MPDVELSGPPELRCGSERTCCGPPGSEFGRRLVGSCRLRSFILDYASLHQGHGSWLLAPEIYLAFDIVLKATVQFAISLWDVIRPVCY